MSNNAHSLSSLWLTEQLVNLKYHVDNISHQKLAILLSDVSNQDVLLFDVRRPEEYQMSRIKGGIQISPEMSAQAFFSRYGHEISNKKLIFYCSVGYRSSEFIQRIEAQADEQNVKAISNLKGGIFRWYNEAHPVINEQGITNAIHPSDDAWADLIEPR